MKTRELQRWLHGHGVDLALFVGGEEVRESTIAYFTGTPLDFGCLAIPAKGKPALFIGGFEHERASRMCKGIDVIKPQDIFSDVRAHFPNAKTLGLCKTKFTLHGLGHLQKAFKDARIADITPIVGQLRLQKTSEEIKRTKQAISITEDIFRQLYADFITFKDETGAASWLRKAAIDAGCDLAYDPIVAAGANGALPHHVSGPSRLSGFVVIDFGVKHKGYCADITRTVYRGTPSAAERKTYALLQRVQQRAVDACLHGTRMDHLDASVRKWLGPHAHLFIHSLGHSLGMDVHDMTPNPDRRRVFTLADGVITTIEPGLYERGAFGMRIEDDVLAAKKGPACLTSLPRDLLVFR